MRFRAGLQFVMSGLAGLYPERGPAKARPRSSPEPSNVTCTRRPTRSSCVPFEDDSPGGDSPRASVRHTPDCDISIIISAHTLTTRACSRPLTPLTQPLRTHHHGCQSAHDPGQHCAHCRIPGGAGSRDLVGQGGFQDVNSIACCSHASHLIYLARAFLRSTNMLPLTTDTRFTLPMITGLEMFSSLSMPWYPSRSNCTPA